MTGASFDRVEELFADLFPLTRSLTGNGVRQTLDRLSDVTPLNVRTVPSGTPVYDWEVPPEWNIRDAYVTDSSGKRVVDFADSNLHVVNYSVPVDVELSFDELSEHLHTLPGMPDAIPYRTTYYERDWGFCIRHDTLEAMDEDETYEVYIDSDLDPEGELTYADAKIEGESEREYIISTYCCHPSLANDNLSGLILATLLFELLRQGSTHHSYRLIVVPETIGAISYLHEHENAMKTVDGGYVVTTVAGRGRSIIRSRSREIIRSTWLLAGRSRATSTTNTSSLRPAATSDSTARRAFAFRPGPSRRTNIMNTTPTTHRKTTSRSSLARHS